MCHYTACCKLTMASKRARKADYTSSEIAKLVRLFVENHDKLVGRFSNDLTHAQKVKIYENIKDKLMRYQLLKGHWNQSRINGKQ